MCPDGVICQAGTSSLRNPTIPCTPGSYCAAGVVTACPGGYYSDKDYLNSSSNCTLCPAGYYCYSGSTHPIICPAGTFCNPGSSTYTNCPAGYYSPIKGLTNANDCLPCPLGNSCGVKSEIPTPCTAGTYSSAIGASSCTSCTAGYYCPING